MASIEKLKDETGRFAIKHGKTFSKEYYIWANMRYRCFNDNCPAYSRYGGRGITICERWNSFENFLADMGEKPQGCSIERKDVNGNYEPDNCVWATAKEQANNRRNTPSMNGFALPEIAEMTGIKLSTIKTRYRRGWDFDKMIGQALQIHEGTMC